MAVTEKLWIQKHRPKQLSEVVLPASVRKDLEGFLKDGDIPNLIFNGTAGLGKTSSALAIINQLKLDYIDING